MSLRFRVFRQALCFLLFVLAGSSLCFAIYLSKFFFRQGIVWMLISVEVSSCIRSSWSTLRKPLFSSPQSVASEAVGLFVLFPFQLIVALLLSSIKPRLNMPIGAFMTLRMLVVSGALIHMVYTLALLTIAMLTVPAFDADVWLRDLDSSPSPFPVAIIFGYAFPCIARLFDATRPFVREPTPLVDPSPSTPCLPTCPPNCTTHGSIRGAVQKTVEPNTERGAANSSDTLRTQEIKQPPVLPHTLIRIPNAAERRNSIYVDLNLTI